MKWHLDYDGNHRITVNMQDLEKLKDSKLEGRIEYLGEDRFPCSLEISENGNSINGLSFKIDDKPVGYKLKIRPQFYNRLCPGDEQKITLNRHNETDETLTLRVE